MKNKLVLLLAILCLALINRAVAQDSNTSDSAKLDSILAMQKQMNKRLDKKAHFYSKSPVL